MEGNGGGPEEEGNKAKDAAVSLGVTAVEQVVGTIVKEGIVNPLREKAGLPLKANQDTLFQEVSHHPAQPNTQSVEQASQPREVPPLQTQTVNSTTAK